MTNTITKVYKNGVEYGIYASGGADVESASSTTAGVVKLGSDTVQTVAANSPSSSTGKTYPVQVNSSGQAVVNVPRAAGSGDVTGPSSSTDADIALFNGTTGKIIKDSGKKLSDYQTALSTQTAYTSKGTASKVPQITTNTLGQVTGITEVNISYPSQVSDTAYASSWDGVTGTAPSKNAVYDKINTMDSTIGGKQSQHTPLSLTLTTGGWSSNTQTVTATGVTASNSVIVGPAPTSITDYTDAKIYCSAQGSNSLTFTCDTAPTNNITVNVIILN